MPWGSTKLVLGFVFSQGTLMSFSGYEYGSPLPVSTPGAEDSEPAPTVPGSASSEGISCSFSGSGLFFAHR